MKGPENLFPNIVFEMLFENILYSWYVDACLIKGFQWFQNPVFISKDRLLTVVNVTSTMLQPYRGKVS